MVHGDWRRGAWGLEAVWLTDLGREETPGRGVERPDEDWFWRVHRCRGAAPVRPRRDCCCASTLYQKGKEELVLQSLKIAEWPHD